MDGTAKTAGTITAAEAVLPAPDLAATVAFFTGRLGFKMLTIFPADDPATAVLDGHGLRLRLERFATCDPGALRLLVSDPVGFADGAREIEAPNGTRIEIEDADPPLVIPPSSGTLTVTRMAGDASWIVGRAGMLYRDLIPGRDGGRFIASHIRIPNGGPVPDNVHFHKIRFQMIYCYRGWVRLAYEDQGPPFVMQAGDCVLQPPQIRHRVLESSDGLEVIEIGCPAEHLTFLDHDMDLPTGRDLPDRDFGGQRFVFHQAARADWRPWRLAGFEARDLGIGAATDGLAGVKVARLVGSAMGEWVRHAGEFLFLFVLEGGATLAAEGHGDVPLAAGDCATVPAGLSHALTDPRPGLEILEVALPAELPFTP